MKAKISLSALVSSTILASGIVLAAVNPTFACPFSNVNGVEGFSFSNTPNLTSNQVNKIALLGASFASIAGVLTGSCLIKRRADKIAEAVAQMPQDDPFAVSSFVITIPPEALHSFVEVTVDEEQFLSVN